MPDIVQIPYTHQEVVIALVKVRNIHEGVWGLYVEFGITAANIPGPNGEYFPAAIVPVVKIGLQPFDAPNSIAVDAAVVNPAPAKPTGSARRPRKTKAKT